jgi:hypothetical protein
MKVSLFVLCSFAVIAYAYAYPAEEVQKLEVVPVAVEELNNNNDEVIREKRQFGINFIT